MMTVFLIPTILFRQVYFDPVGFPLTLLPGRNHIRIESEPGTEREREGTCHGLRTRMTSFIRFLPTDLGANFLTDLTTSLEAGNFRPSTTTDPDYPEFT